MGTGMTNEIKVAVHGSYFADNYGDTLLVRILCDKVAAIVGPSNVYLAIPGHLREQKDIGYPVIGPNERSEITHLVFGGGGYFGERTNRFFDSLAWSIRNFRRHLSWVKHFRSARRAVIGAGFGPISNSLLLSRVRSFMSSCEVVLVRDNESFAFMESYDIHPRSGTCVDLALSLPIVNSPRTGVALHVDNLSQDEIDAVFSGIKLAIGADDSIDVIFDNRPSDTKASRSKYIRAASKHEFPACRFVEYEDVNTLLERLTTYSFVVTSKLHVGITTIAQGGRAIAIPGHQKTVRLYRQLGLQQYCIDRSGFSSQALADAISKLDGYEPDRSVIREGLERVDKALSEFIHGRSSDERRDRS